MIKLVDSSNPLPTDAEHTEAAPLPSETHGSNPLPHDADHTPAPAVSTAADSNPLPGSESKPSAKSASNDLLIPAVGYVFWLLALIALMGNNAKAKFHGAQALLFFAVIGLLYLPVLILTGLLGVMIPILGMLVFLAYVLIIVAVPLYMAFKTYKGADVLLPVIGRFAADKMDYKPA